MIKTFIVDDDHLVRKGLIHTLPWEKYGLEIVGEADNGDKAINYLQEYPVDLLFVDITMPKMSGFELMDQVKSRFPDVSMVVLTCHQDFNYVQKALRLGAIDYMVKTQLKNKALEDMLQRIVTRIEEKAINLRKTVLPSTKLSSGPTRGILLASPFSKHKVLLEDGKTSYPKYTIKLDNEALFIPQNEEILITPETDWLLSDVNKRQWGIVNIHNDIQLEMNDLCRCLLEYKDRHLFYEYKTDRKVNTLSLTDRDFLSKIVVNEQDSQRIRKAWQSFYWLFDDSEFSKWIQTVVEKRLPATELVTMFKSTVTPWKHMCSLPEANDWIKNMDTLAWWRQWLSWLGEVRDTFSRKIVTFRYSQEIVASILKSITIINDHLQAGINQREVAGQVNLSRGYFSHVFKEVVGKSFHEFVQELRIDRARFLLMKEKYRPIYWIAEKAGFQDEKYFSRVFRKCTGWLPSEYRVQAMKKSF